jgi:hypothetical protein
MSNWCLVNRRPEKRYSVFGNGWLVTETEEDSRVAVARSYVGDVCACAPI